MHRFPTGVDPVRRSPSRPIRPVIEGRPDKLTDSGIYVTADKHARPGVKGNSVALHDGTIGANRWTEELLKDLFY